MAALMEKIADFSIEVHVLAEELKKHKESLAMSPEQGVTTMMDAMSAMNTDQALSKEKYMSLVEYWNVFELIKIKNEMLEMLKAEVRSLMETGEEPKGGRRYNGGGRNHQGGGVKRLDAKSVAHIKENKFGGKEGGGGWVNFMEDLMVAIGAIDKELEKAIKDVRDLKKTDLDEPKDVKELVDREMWGKYSGELFARLMEITRDDAQTLVRHEGVKLSRCGFWFYEEG